jgi:cell division protein FtsA
MCDMAERVLNCQTRNGLTIGVRDWPEELNNTAWTVAAGLSMYSARLKLRRETRRKAPGIVGLVLR